MTFFWVFTVTSRVVRQVAVGPALLFISVVGWLCTVISVEIGEGSSEFRDVLQCFDDLKLACSER